jgi:hypothetical protein
MWARRILNDNKLSHGEYLPPQKYVELRAAQ